MSAPDQLNATAFAVFGPGVPRSGLAGSLAGLAAPALGWRRAVLTRPVQILAGAILVATHAAAQLGGGVGKQPLVIGLAPRGRRQWRPGRPPSSGLVHVIYLVLVLWGRRDWWPRSRTAVAAPAPEGAAA